ncbi:LGFP repeat-containing protein [Blastococcus sp. KM273128]|uniref:LGFP repeat-containing protein n=1 Tax=Blastococcus sp. KM273128 TaxID=2570314 RepID=UPI001F183ACA|nr:hypothetical protein [Blastococcus sp. KM273128]
MRGGSFSLFTGGAIYWSPSTGAHFVKGAIYERWARSGYESGLLGFPTQDEINTTGGAVGRFTGGAIYWSPSTGARVVAGAVYETYLQVGAERGALGFPTAEATAYSGGSRVEFQRGSITVDVLGRATVTTN